MAAHDPGPPLGRRTQRQAPRVRFIAEPSPGGLLWETRKGQYVFVDDFFTDPEREKVSDAGKRLFKALQALGIDLDNFDISSPCVDRHCCKNRETLLSLGSYRPDVANEAAERLEHIAQALAAGTARD